MVSSASAQIIANEHHTMDFLLNSKILEGDDSPLTRNDIHHRYWTRVRFSSLKQKKSLMPQKLWFAFRAAQTGPSGKNDSSQYAEIGYVEEGSIVDRCLLFCAQ